MLSNSPRTPVSTPAAKALARAPDKFAEPTLDEILGDPIVKLLMSVDRVSNQDLQKVISNYHNAMHRQTPGLERRGAERKFLSRAPKIPGPFAKFIVACLNLKRERINGTSRPSI